MPDTSPVYHPRKPQDSQYYQCVEDHFERLEQVYDERFARKYSKLIEEAILGYREQEKQLTLVGAKA